MDESKKIYKAVLFDLDDTLLKTAQIKWQHHKHTAKKHYDIELTDEVLAEHWGKPFPELVGHLYQNSDTTENMIAANRADEADFPKEIQKDTQVTIARLKTNGFILGVVTAINTSFAVNDLKRVGINAEEFLFIQGADDTEFHKPDPRVFEPAIKSLAKKGIDKKDVVYVGDTLADYLAAREAGLYFIGVATGHVKLEKFISKGAQAAGSLDEVADIILSEK